jgi:hypothetical protein
MKSKSIIGTLLFSDVEEAMKEKKIENISIFKIES